MTAIKNEGYAIWFPNETLPAARLRDCDVERRGCGAIRGGRRLEANFVQSYKISRSMPPQRGSQVMAKPCVEGIGMADHIYRVIELAGSSEVSHADAVENAISRAAKTMRILRWFEVTQMRGEIEGGAIRHYQVTMKVGFTLEDK